MTDFLEFMQMENSHKTDTIPVEKRLNGEYEIEFKDVSFYYPNSEEMITLNGIDIRKYKEDEYRESFSAGKRPPGVGD